MAELMRDHTKHAHCAGCGACYPSAQLCTNHWCSACRKRITAALPIGAGFPWSATEVKLPIETRVVRLRSANGEVDRVVLDETPTMVLVCRAETLELARLSRRAPASVWFKKTDIIVVT
jgi:hypothetical protein